MASRLGLGKQIKAATKTQTELGAKTHDAD
jgi:hypothetical protein